MTLSHDEKYFCPSAPPRVGQADFRFVSDKADAINIDIAFTYVITYPH